MASLVGILSESMSGNVQSAGQVTGAVSSSAQTSGGVNPGSTLDHSVLNNRDSEDQHPISAITDLQDSLDEKVEEAPEDDKLYARKDSDWVEIEENADKAFIFTQATPSAEWLITHNLNKRPSITIIDSSYSAVVGDYQYIDDNTVKCTFAGEFSGKAYLN